MGNRDSFNEKKKIVIKIGTSSLTHANGSLNLRVIETLTSVLSDLKNSGKDIILVSSGAIGVGAARMGFKEKPKKTMEKQAAAAVGQAALMQIYQSFFNTYNQKIGQILMTKDIVEEETKRTNTINTFNTLLEFGIIPIVNENDTISTYEIEFTDNDNLSANVACLLNADMLVILTDIDGLYNKNPRKFEDAKKITYIKNIDSSVLSMGDNEGSMLGKGGMKSKLVAAKLATDAGIDVLIVNGDDPKIIYNVFDGEKVGTYFAGKNNLF